MLTTFPFYVDIFSSTLRSTLGYASVNLIQPRLRGKYRLFMSWLTGYGSSNTNTAPLQRAPFHHPIVTEEGWDGAKVERQTGLDTVKIAKAGYNYLRLLFGLERDGTAILARKTKDIAWDAATAGYGVRGSSRTDVTMLFESEFSSTVVLYLGLKVLV